ncbi:uncharacterized protein LOC131973693 [Centropristis striata]|uniref:uncharacterized protein LOC131973693 n=1 Tax=Centropristis striata TaxID=184440 RepID=UPI0027E172EF|nr:uncharacterized protein LOC131973693 [Centropristis striata]
MKVLWIICQLIGSITCYPVGKEYGANSADTSLMWQPFSSGYWLSGMGMRAGPGSISPLSLLPNLAAASAIKLPAPQDAISTAHSPEFNENGAYPGYGYDIGTPGFGFSSSDRAPVGDSWSSGSANAYEAGDHSPESVFSDVSDLEQLDYLNSHSSYKRGRRVLAQMRFTPEEPVIKIPPVPTHIRKTPKHSGHVKAPTKGVL